MTSRILIVSHEAPGVSMSGPAIRAWELAHALSAEHRVTLAVPGAPALSTEQLRLVPYDQDGASLRRCLAECDAVLASGYLLRHFPFLRDGPPLVIDLYDPFILENLEIHSQAPLPDQSALHRVDLAVLNEQIQHGDFFLCASEQQRDFWLGMLAANGRVNPHTLRADASLRRLIAVVPFGLPAQAPKHRRAVLKGVVPGIGPNDRVVLWGGGLWDWFDPLTAIRAMAALAPRRPDLRLFFAGVRHPNPTVPPMRQAAAAQQLSAELGLTGRHVFFNPWMPYADRADYLLEADVGLSLHYDHVETRFAFRTRLLDCLWTGLPMVLTRGDSLGELAAAGGLARLVVPGDVDGVAQALDLALADAPQMEAQRLQRAAALGQGLQWPQVAAPLTAFCREPRRAPDKAVPAAGPRLRAGLVPKAWQSLRARGVAGLVRDIRLYLGR
jgi:glycosyltransferase involved in cell wall biosynthesis